MLGRVLGLDLRSDPWPDRTPGPDPAPGDHRLKKNTPNKLPAGWRMPTPAADLRVRSLAKVGEQPRPVEGSGRRQTRSRTTGPGVLAVLKSPSPGRQTTRRRAGRSPGPATVTPLDRREVDHPSRDEDQQHRGGQCQGIGAGEGKVRHPGVEWALGRSEIDRAVAVAAPDHHGDRKAEQRSQGSPAKGDEHGIAQATVIQTLPRMGLSQTQSNNGSTGSSDDPGGDPATPALSPSPGRRARR